VNSSACEVFKTDLINEDINHLKTTLQDYADQLPSRKYSKENLFKLADIIKEHCDLVIEQVCVDCIYTLPPQSDIMLTFVLNQKTFSRRLDLAPSNQHEIIFLNVHQ
jgi:hypothetical protein